jgi:hypothetical protein
MNGDELEAKAADSLKNETVCHLLLHRDAGWTARQEPAPLEEPPR